jgi:hypothetical protein
MKRLYQKAVGTLGKDDIKIVEKNYNRINQKDIQKYTYDTSRFDENKNLKKEARRIVLDYLKFHTEKVSPPLPSLEKYDFYHELLLDQLAFECLKEYSYNSKGSQQKRAPPPPSQKIYQLDSVVDKWPYAGSEIGDDTVKVTFEFDFSKVHENERLKKWQASENSKLNPTKPTLVKIVEATVNHFKLANGEIFTDMKAYETRIYDEKGEWVYYTGTLGPRGNNFLEPDYVKQLQSSYLDMGQINKVKEEKRKRKDEIQRSSGPTMRQYEEDLQRNSGPSPAMPAMSPAMSNPSSTMPATSPAMPATSPAMSNSSSTMPATSPAMPATSPAKSSRVDPDAGMSQQELYYKYSSGGKSTRRRQSNTHRRIKQKKRKTKKNNSRRRKNTRK